MAGKYGDSEEIRIVDRIRANAFREAMEAGASFINRKWIAQKIGRSERWVTDNWKKGYDDVQAVFGSGAPQKMSQESKNIVEEGQGKRRRSNVVIAREILERRGKVVSREAIRRYRLREGFKPFHTIPKPMKSKLNVEDRLWFCNFLSEWGEEDFLNLCPSDEFFVYTVRRPNFQNDRVWALSLDEIEDSERYQELCQAPACLGIFIGFTAKRMFWVIKDQGQKWDGAYFREKILLETVFPFLRNPENVLDPDEVCFLHDMAPCFRANETQKLMKDSGIDFFDRTEWPGNSPDLNAAEHLGAIMKDRVESKMIQEQGPNRYLKETLQQHLVDILSEMEFDTELFESLLRSYPSRLRAVRENNGYHTKF